MVRFKLKEKTESFIDFDYYVEGDLDDRGTFRYFPDGPTWETLQPAPGDFANWYSNHIGSSFQRDGIRDEGMVAWY